MSPSTERRPAIFLDHNAGAPVEPALWQQVGEELFAGDFSRERSWNPSSVHSSGRRAKHLLRSARERVARAIDPHLPLQDRLFFVGSASEANQMIVRSLEPDQPWFFAADHHDSIRTLASLGKALPVRPNGLLDLDALQNVLWSLKTQASSPEALEPVFSLLWVNNETGIVQPAEEIESLIFERFPRAWIAWDAVQAWGKFPLRERLCRDRVLLTLSGHKVGAFPGVGILIQPSRPWARPLIHGKQERGLRGGTESLPAIVSLGLAAEGLGSSEAQAREAARLLQLRETFEEGLLRRKLPLTVTGQGLLRSPNTTHLVFESRIVGEQLLAELDLEGFQLSTGSACQAGFSEPSAVLLAMGYPDEKARAALRISTGRQTRPEHLDSLTEALEKCLRLRDNPKA
jgi:cysteine desulfurase